MHKLLRRGRWLWLLTVLAVVPGFTSFSQTPKRHVLDLESPAQLRAFLHYSPDRIPFVSAHRGGPLMHDPTLDRTTTGRGKVSDYTLEELRKLRLKDTEGRVTEHSIPTLGEALEWAKGKTVLVIDQKDVPIAARVAEIRKYQAEANAMVMAYNFEDAKLAYSLNPELLMEVFIPDRAAADRFGETGVPWENVVAFVTHTQPKDTAIFQHLHDKGTMAIVGSSRTIDKDFADEKISKTDLDKGYHAIIASGADIIEADLAIEAGEALMKRPKKKSSKNKYFIKKIVK